MTRECSDCKIIYNDEYYWTICPHNPLDGGPGKEDYCRRHDLFNCYICREAAI